MNTEIEIDHQPSTAISSTRYPMVKPYADNTPMLPARNAAQIMQQILATPAPVPQRQTEVVKRERLEGASEKSTPVMRAVASAIRSVKFVFMTIPSGVILYKVAISTSGNTSVSFLFALTAVVAVQSYLFLRFDGLEYRHSQPGVELARDTNDHELDMAHEINRHTETLTAIEGDIAIKLEVLKIANGSRRIADKGGSYD